MPESHQQDFVNAIREGEPPRRDRRGVRLGGPLPPGQHLDARRADPPHRPSLRADRRRRRGRSAFSSRVLSRGPRPLTHALQGRRAAFLFRWPAARALREREEYRRPSVRDDAGSRTTARVRNRDMSSPATSRPRHSSALATLPRRLWARWRWERGRRDAPADSRDIGTGRPIPTRVTATSPTSSRTTATGSAS